MPVADIAGGGYFHGHLAVVEVNAGLIICCADTGLRVRLLRLIYPEDGSQGAVAVDGNAHFGIIGHDGTVFHPADKAVAGSRFSLDRNGFTGQVDARPTGGASRVGVNGEFIFYSYLHRSGNAIVVVGIFRSECYRHALQTRCRARSRIIEGKAAGDRSFTTG